MGDPLRVAIVGAGPAGCLMAASLLRLARVRRKEAQIHLFGARSSWGPDRPLVLDEPSVATLTALGIPLPSGQRLEGILTAHGARTAALPAGLHVLPRNRLVGLLRALLHAQGVGLMERRVAGIAALPQGGYVVRADGASFTADAVVLCCGAGAPIAAGIEGHRPPPAVRTLGARFAQAPPLPPFLRRHPLPGEDLWLLPLRDGAASLLVGDGANARSLGLRLVELGLEHPSFAWGTPEQLFSFWVPDGAARPALPCLGSALGGTPRGPSLREIAEQADRLALALFDEGVGEATALAREEAAASRPAIRTERRAFERIRRFPVPVRERALKAPRRARLPTFPQRALSGEPLGLGQALLAFLLLFWLWLRTAFTLRRAPPRPRAEKDHRPVFVVEDDPLQAEGLCAHLRARGFTCRSFSDAMQAVQAAAHDPPAALVVDLALPWVDGADALRALRRSWLSETPVLVTSALPQGEEVVRGGLADGWLEKPLDLERLGQRLDDLVGRRANRLPKDPKASGGEPISWG